MKYSDLKLLSSILQSVITNEETKVQKKLIKIYDKLKPSLQEYQDKANELRIDNASVDEKDILLLDEKGNYRFSKQNIKILNKQLQELDNQEVKFEKIAITNPQGLEQFLFLKDWIIGVPFQEEEEEEL